MYNYYDNCINDIENHIRDGEMALALAIVQKELAMPYVPEPYFTQFQHYVNDIVIDQQPRSQFFDSLEEIEASFQGNAALQQKALLSLERMNLRSAVSWISEILTKPAIIDGIKKQVLLYMLEQEIQGEFEILLEGSLETLSMKDLKHPVESDAYQQCHHDLRNMLESHNPSLLLLCIGELDYAALESFPHSLKSIKAQSIIDRVESYLQ